MGMTVGKDGKGEGKGKKESKATLPFQGDLPFPNVVNKIWSLDSL